MVVADYEGEVDVMVMTNDDRADALLLKLLGFVAMVVIVDGRVRR